MPQLDKREVTTGVLVDNGQTVVLGGVYEISKADTQNKVPLLGEIPLETEIREGGDSGSPWATQEGESPAQTELRKVADSLAHRSRNLAGRGLGVTPV